MGADVVELAVRRGAEVDRRRATAGGGRPGRAQELLAGGDQVVGAAADPLGLDHDDLGVVGHHVDEELHARRRAPGASDSMPSTAIPAARKVISASCGWASPSAAARRRTSSVSSSSRHGGAHSRGSRLDVRWSATANERTSSTSSPQNSTRTRVLLGRREDVDETAADRELAALLDQVDPGVRRVREPAYDVVELDGVTRRELDRLEVAEPATWGCRIDRTGATTTRSRPVPRRRRGVAVGAGRPAGGPRCRCAG